MSTRLNELRALRDYLDAVKCELAALGDGPSTDRVTDAIHRALHEAEQAFGQTEVDELAALEQTISQPNLNI